MVEDAKIGHLAPPLVLVLLRAKGWSSQRKGNSPFFHLCVPPLWNFFCWSAVRKKWTSPHTGPVPYESPISIFRVQLDPFSWLSRLPLLGKVPVPLPSQISHSSHVISPFFVLAALSFVVVRFRVAYPLFVSWIARTTIPFRVEPFSSTMPGNSSGAKKDPPF